MKKLFSTLLILVALQTGVRAVPSAGFFLPDSVSEFLMKYKTVNNLIVLPVTINDSVRVNLILDTGCRNMILFGKRFQDLLVTGSKSIEFSGLGSGKHVVGKLSLNNAISIGEIRGRQIPIIVVPQKNLFSSFSNIHGVIGYEIFVKFEIELNFAKETIAFRPGSEGKHSPHFDYVPMKVVDSRPLIECSIHTDESIKTQDLVIDTGSSLGLILGTTQSGLGVGKTIGRGLNGAIQGANTITKKMTLHSLEFNNIDTSLIFRKENYASIGMEFLKSYKVILNYTKSYVGFSKA